jgi:hypothetical protein
MNARTCWRLLCAAGVALGLCLAGLARADEKGQKGPSTGKDDKTVIVIQLDVSKAPPELVKQLMALSKATALTEATKKTPAKTDDDEKKKKSAQKEEDAKKGGSKTRNVVEVDLNKLSPELAKRLQAELAKIKGGNPGNDDEKRKPAKKDDDDDGDKKKAGKDDDKKKPGGKKDDDDDDDKKKGVKDDDDKKKPGEKKKDD